MRPPFSLVCAAALPLWCAALRPAVKHQRLLLFCLAVLTTALPVSAWAQADDAPRAVDDADRIIEVRVEGARRVEPEAVARALKQQVGDVFDPGRTADDLRALWGLKYFDDVQLLVQRTAKGVAYVVRVTEKPSVRSVALSGNDALSKDDFKDVIDIRAFTILDVAAIKRNVKKIQDKYLEKGFFLAEVTYTITPSADGHEVDVVFVIDEHAKVEVTEVNLLGVKSLPQDDLRALMATRVGGYLSFITSEGTYREELFQRDLQVIQMAYLDHGFVNVRVEKPTVALSPDKRFIAVTIVVEEGDQYTLGALDVTGDLLEPKEAVLGRLASREGMVFNRSALAQDIQTINDAYYDRGYAYANVTPVTSVDAESKVISLTFNVEKGSLVYIERIDIIGNTKTRDKVIRRQLRVYEGELFSGVGVRRSREKVTALGFFETVEVTHKPGSDGEHVVLQVEVKEKSTGQFQVGLGFSNVESFIFTAQIAQQNFLGWGQSVSASAQLSALRSFFQLQYFDPYFLDTNFIFSVDAYRTQLDYFGFIRTATGGSLGLGYYLVQDELSVNVGYTAESVQLEAGRDFVNSVSLSNQFRSGITSALRLSSTWDRRDNRLFPSSGWYLSAMFETAPRFLNPAPESMQYNFNRVTANARGYVKLPLGAVLKGQATLGYIQDIVPDVPLPSSELYFLGGINTIRGYPLRTITPKELVGCSTRPDATSCAFGVGGNKQAVFNLELELPLLEKVGIRGVLFYDAGNVYRSDANFFQHIPDDSNKNLTLPLGMYHSVGFGVRWFSPIGPLRFEWGVPLNRRVGDEPIQFEFNIGNSF